MGAYWRKADKVGYDGGLAWYQCCCFDTWVGMTVPEVELLLVGVRKDLCNRDIHCYAPM
jgi:hypothetical protein